MKLSQLASGKGLVTNAMIVQIQRWLNDDWKCQDLDPDAFRLISRLVETLGTERKLPLYVDCPQCGADPGQECKSDKPGQPVSKRMHNQRVRQ